MFSIKKTVVYGLVAVLLLLVGCRKYYVSVSQQWVDARYLASTHVNTPDPRQANPPVGQMVMMDWRVPKAILDKKPYIQLKVIFWNYTEKVLCFPVHQRMGWVTYQLLNEEYNAVDGILTYKAEIITEDGEVFCDWKHQLWVNLITLKEDQGAPVEQLTEEVH